MTNQEAINVLTKALGDYKAQSVFSLEPLVGYEKYFTEKTQKRLSRRLSNTTVEVVNVNVFGDGKKYIVSVRLLGCLLATKEEKVSPESISPFLSHVDSLCYNDYIIGAMLPAPQLMIGVPFWGKDIRLRVIFMPIYANPLKESDFNKIMASSLYEFNPGALPRILFTEKGKCFVYPLKEEDREELKKEGICF